MRYCQSIVCLLVVLAFAAGAPLPAGAQTVNHSGTILAVDNVGGTIVLGEVGPWRVERGVTEMTRRVISVTASTKFVEVKRSTDTLFPGDFVETALDAGALKVGDFVTVECRHEGKRMTALKVIVPKLEGS